MDEKRVGQWAEQWIGRNLDARRWCYYHLCHVRHVVEDVTEFGREAGVSAPELSTLIAAAWLHDTGYATDPDRHEEVSALIAREILPGLGASSEEMALIASLILATDPARPPQTPLEELIRDADVGQLATPNFPHSARLFRRELEQGGTIFSDAAFWRFERDFLARLHFFTAAARKLRNAGLERSRAFVAGELARREKEAEA